MIGQILNLKFMLSLVTVVHSEQVSGIMNKLSGDESNDCICRGDTLTFECTVVNELGTIWSGSAFNCASSGNETYLLRNTFDNQTCNDGMITGQVIRRQDNNYTTQLNVIPSSELIGKSVECAKLCNNGSKRLIFSTTLDIMIVTDADSFPPPDEILLTQIDFSLKEITFSWSPVAPDCPAIHYSILASNCGRCPTTTKHTSVTCTDILRFRNDSVCTLAIETVVCGNITGNQSEPLTLNITKTLEIASSKKATVDTTTSLSIFIIGVITLLITIVIVILTCYWLRNRKSAINRSSRLNETAIASSYFGSSSSLQSQANSQEENTQTFQHTSVPCSENTDEYSKLEETPVSLKRLLEKLQGQVSKQWYQLGLALGLPMDVLEGFNLYSEDDCLTEVLDYWLKHHKGKPTWQEITDAQKKVVMFNTEQETGTSSEKKVAATSDLPPPKPPRRTSSVTMKKSISPSTQTTTNDEGHVYEAID